MLGRIGRRRLLAYENGSARNVCSKTSAHR